jgi:menaquinone C8-methyltransferase
MIREILLTYYMKLLLSRYMQLDATTAVELPAPESEKKLLLYIHIPFCEQLCPYCSFIREEFDGPLAAEYMRCLQQEIEAYKERGYIFSAVYVGGGTPTIVAEELVSLLDRVRTLWPIKEISVETNPNHLNESVLGRLQAAGVNRLSVGVQSFDNELLKRLDRYHKYGPGEQIRKRLENIRGRFDTLNVDMIFNLPGQTRKSLEQDLEVLLDIEAAQITYYPLMTGNRVKNRLFRRYGHSSYRKERDFYRSIEEALGKSYKKATAWCFSKKSGMIDEYIVGYNEYVGAGAGAFGYHHGRLYANSCRVSDYIRRMHKGELPIIGTKRFSHGQRMRYALLMELFGGRVELAMRSGHLIDTSMLLLSGTVERRSDGFHLSTRGYYFLVIMMREFFNSVNNFRDFCR